MAEPIDNNLNNNPQGTGGENSATGTEGQQGTQQSQLPDGQGNNPGQSEKTFTQDEVNSIVQKRLEQQSKKMPSEEELTAYREWLESQKTEEEKQTEKIQAEAMQIANRRLVRAEAKVMAITLNVKPERIDHAIRLADLSEVEVDEHGNVEMETLKAALERVTQEIPELLIQKQQEGDTGTGFKIGGSGSKGTATADEISRIFGNK